MRRAEATQPRPERDGGIKVIARAAAVLRALRGERAGLSLGRIAARVGLPRSTVQRIVAALVEEGLLLASDGRVGIRLGPEIVALAAEMRLDFVDLAHPFLKALAEATGETVDLATLRGRHMLFLDQVQGSHRLRAISAVGEVFPLTSTANGKACLALLRPAEAERLVRAELGEERAIEAERVLAELEAVRESGLAFDRDEHTPGISAIGVAFADPAGALYAISVPVPSHRFPAKAAELAERLVDAKERLLAASGQAPAEPLRRRGRP